MSFRRGGAGLVARAIRQVETPSVSLPVFLCPALVATSFLSPTNSPYKFSQRRKVHTIPKQTDSSRTNFLGNSYSTENPGARLPPQCSGCGALSQTVDKKEPGFYNLRRRGVREYVEGKSADVESHEDRIIQEALENTANINPEIQLNIPTRRPNAEQALEPPLCERCHKLKHHEEGVSIAHPTLQSLEDTISESPYKYNHLYHVIDAADFPMSIIPGIHRILNMTPQRSLNRRSKSGRFYHGKKTEISFIITRSDLLAPKKEQVDSMMPYLRTVLREALGRDFKESRLGNIRCVSAKSNWWTKELKEDIWDRGGGGWVIGKVNVGKSRLFHEVFPKGRTSQTQALKPLKPVVLDEPKSSFVEKTGSISGDEQALSDLKESLTRDIDPAKPGVVDELSLLPAAQPETDYPTMPLVSSLPGTTASPIRIPFGNGKGELIDLPGLSRGNLELHVQPEHRASLIMRQRIRPEQEVIKPGQSLLLGGFIRITPVTPDVIFLSYAFNPLKAHLTSTEKARGIQEETRESNVLNIAVPGTGEKIRSAGVFHLRWDVTKQRTGPITAKDAANIHVDRLPYRVMAADILIEGCGWVEIVAQVRKPRIPKEQKDQDLEEDAEVKEEAEKEASAGWPAVEVFTPEGKFIGIRQPLNAWLNVRFKPGEKNMKARPRRSMKGQKKLGKARARAAQAA
ncbi:hypothetical protein B0O99DRAFT_635154 [Bisporella sp. PMI_857]|nr:hypothetical protein B0O99DRAFT_635154 [Bisporella sp. PMI_857]